MKFGKLGMFFVTRNRRFAWRAGRRLYKMARNDVHNSIETNGEVLLQQSALRLAKKRNTESFVAFDVGANLGLWTRSLIRVAKESGFEDQVRVHAFEPFPATYESVTEKLAELIKTSKVVCNRLALSDEAGEVTMYGKPNAGTSAIHRGDDESDLQAVQVKRNTVDNYCDESGIDEIHLLKCDAEGHDFRIIAGAGEMLKAGKIWFLQFEYTHFWVFSRHFLKDVFDFIGEMQYEIGKLTPEGLEIYDQWHPELERFFDGNYVLVRSDLVDQIPTKRVSADASNTFA